MGRQIDKLTFGPPAVCDTCGGFACVLFHAGMRCYHCSEGTFLHRTAWRFERCPECGGVGLCRRCNNKGILAFPRSNQVTPRE